MVGGVVEGWCHDWRDGSWDGGRVMVGGMDRGMVVGNDGWWDGSWDGDGWWDGSWDGGWCDAIDRGMVVG